MSLVYERPLSAKCRLSRLRSSTELVRVGSRGDADRAERKGQEVRGDTLHGRVDALLSRDPILIRCVGSARGRTHFEVRFRFRLRAARPQTDLPLQTRLADLE